MWCDKELEEKRKLRYYKDVINPNLEDQNYLSVFPSVKKKISIVKIRTNSHELHSETGRWSIPKTPWDERVCHLCDTKKVEDEKHFLLDCPAYTHIRAWELVGKVPNWLKLFGNLGASTSRKWELGN
jgi:hypothetical protein